MTFRTFVFAGLAFVAAGCGDYSNEDFVFANAVPRAEDLRSKLTPPEENALTARPPAGGALVDPANGDLSAVTRGGSAAFNGGLEALLALLETAIAQPPTTRELGRRIWGPFVDEKAPLWEARLVMDRLEGDAFAYRVEIRPRNTEGAAWTSILDGTLESLEGIRRGRGTMWLRAAAARLAGRETPGLEWLETFTATYDTSDFPVLVTLLGTGTPESALQLLYTYREEENGSGAMSFSTTYDGIPNVGTLSLAITSRWLASGAGEGTATVTAGTLLNAVWTQCWNASFGLVYSFRSWSLPPEGASLECPVF